MRESYKDCQHTLAWLEKLDKQQRNIKKSFFHASCELTWHVCICVSTQLLQVTWAKEHGCIISIKVDDLLCTSAMFILSYSTLVYIICAVTCTQHPHVPTQQTSKNNTATHPCMMLQKETRLQSNQLPL